MGRVERRRGGGAGGFQFSNTVRGVAIISCERTGNRLSPWLSTRRSCRLRRSFAPRKCNWPRCSTTRLLGAPASRPVADRGGCLRDCRGNIWLRRNRCTIPRRCRPCHRAPGIWLALAGRVGLGLRIAIEPCEGFQFFGTLSEIKAGAAAGAAGILPLRFGGQPVSAGGKIALPRVCVIARPQTFLRRPRIAERHCRRPGDLLGGVPGILAAGGVFPGDFLVNLLGDFLLIHEKAVHFDLMRRLGVRWGLRSHPW